MIVGDELSIENKGITEEYLKSFEAKKKRAQVLRDRIRELDDCMTMISPVISDMPRGGGGPSEGFAKLIPEQCDLKAELLEELNEIYKQERDMRRAFKMLSDTERTLMELRYIQCLTWEHICVQIGYEYSNTHRIHQRAMKGLGVWQDRKKMVQNGTS